MKSIFPDTIVEIIITSSLLIISIFIIRQVFKGKINPPAQYFLWLLVALRLLIPISVSSPLSIMNAFPDTEIKYQPVASADEGNNVNINPGSPNINGPESEKPHQIPQNETTPNDMPIYDYKENNPAENTSDLTSIYSMKNIFYVYIFITFFILTYLIYINIKFNIFVRKNSIPITNNHVIKDAFATAGIQKEIPVYLSDKIQSPQLAGIIKNKIYITPKSLESDSVLRHVILHELFHYKQKDNFFALIRNLCCVIYWFNPLVHLAAVYSRQDCELACDYRVLSLLEDDEKTGYGFSLLELVRRKNSNKGMLYITTSMSGKKKFMKERIMMISNFAKFKKYALSAVIIIMIPLIVFFFTGKNTIESNVNSPQNKNSPGNSSKPSGGDEISEREISSQDILKISKGMTYSEIINLLGSTYYYEQISGAPSFYSYIVDGTMRYTQTFSKWTDICELSGEELLNKIKTENNEEAPFFVDPKTACENIKNNIFNTNSWFIIFANESFVYASYEVYEPYILRYNVKTNKIDRVLDVSGLQRFYPLVHAMVNFTPDGRYMIFRNNINWVLGDPVVKRLLPPFPAMYVYEIDFDGMNVNLLTKTQDNWNVPGNYSYRRQLLTKYKLKMDEKGYQFYNGDKKITISGLERFFITGEEAVAPVNDDICAVIIYPEDKPGEHGYSSFAIINVKDGKLIKRCAINEG